MIKKNSFRTVPLFGCFQGLDSRINDLYCTKKEHRGVTTKLCHLFLVVNVCGRQSTRLECFLVADCSWDSILNRDTKLVANLSSKQVKN
jgi:hypothetical protein